MKPLTCATRLCVLVVTGLTLLSSPLFLAHTSAEASNQCTRQTLPITLSPVDPTSYTLVGWLCGKAPLPGRTLQVLLHGGTYNHTYWDTAYKPQLYSYVDAMTKAGYATFMLDRIGYGESDHPVPELITIQTNAFMVHQVVQALRSGTIEGIRFGKVILVGHSMGTATAWEEASRYNDVDGVINTGLLHNSDVNFIARAFSNLYPASSDPQFQTQGLPPGYLTTQPGTRDELFYYPSNADPQVIASDETTKDTLTDGELETIGPSAYSLASRSITVPVFSLIGEYDNVSCGGTINCHDPTAVYTYEAQYYAPQACFELAVVPNTGHSLNLHLSADTTYQRIQTWLQRRIGVTPQQPPTDPCQ